MLSLYDTSTHEDYWVLIEWFEDDADVDTLCQYVAEGIAGTDKTWFCPELNYYFNAAGYDTPLEYYNYVYPIADSISWVDYTVNPTECQNCHNPSPRLALRLRVKLNIIETYVCDKCQSNWTSTYSLKTIETELGLSVPSMQTFLKGY